MSARYSRQKGFVISKRTPARSPIRTVQKRVKLGPTAAKFIGLLVLAILVGFMLTQSGNSATNAYVQNDLNAKKSQAEEDNQALMLQVERARSLNAIQQTPVKDQMQPTDQFDQVAGASTAKP